MFKSTNFLVACALFMWVAASFAQPVYRIVGADGKVSFSDKPPTEPTAKAALGKGVTSGSGTSAGNSALPFELRQVAAKFPVTLYTGENCSPCQSARSMLTTRGVPFAEKTVNTNNDIQALQRLGGDNSLPFGTIGGQQLKGYSDAEWTQFLNAAGYPASSVLPSSYRQQAAAPLVAADAVSTVSSTAQAVSPAARAGARPPTAATPAPAPEPAVSPANPTGIKF